MSIVDRYVARTFLSGYAILLLVGIGVYILTDLLVNLDVFTEDRTLSLVQVLEIMWDYYSYNIPLYFSQLGGPLMAIAAAFTVGLMLRNNELVALVAAGMPLQRLTVPLVGCSLLIVGLWVANQELVIPACATKIARSHDDMVGTRTVGVYCARDDNNAILTALQLDPRRGVLRRVFIIEPDEQGQPAQLIEADRAEYVPERGVWRLDRGRRITMSAPTAEPGLGDAIRYPVVDEYPFTLGPEELVLRQGAQWAELLSVREMNALLHSRNLPNLPAISMSRHIRLTKPLLFWILMILVLPFLLTREPTSVLVGGGQALLFGGLFFAMAFVTHALAPTAIEDESRRALMAWVPILIFGPIAVLHLANAKT
jgi:lipopolysaccharide export system permease protein